MVYMEWDERNAEDATITNNNANSAPHSIYLSSTAASGGPQDVVLKFGQLYNSEFSPLNLTFMSMLGKMLTSMFKVQ